MQERLDNLGEGIESGTVVDLLVSEGDEVTEGQTLLEIESEKAVLPIPASQNGVIAKLLVKAGDSVSVGQSILDYEASGNETSKPNPSASTATSPAAQPAAIPSKQPAAPRPAAAAPPPPQPATQDLSGPIPAASPTVKRIAHQLALDLRLVPSASPGGRVELADLRNWIHSLIHTIPTAAEDTPAASPKPAPKQIPFEKWGPIRREKLSEIRKAISRHMVESKNSQPHVTQIESVDITDLEALRKAHAAEWKKAGVPLTLTVLAVKACVTALKKHPIFNASIDETSNEIVFKDYFHIGIAADTEHGLMVPVIKDADQLSLVEIAQAIPDLANQARSRKLGKEAMQGGTFTISNQGGIGGAHFTPVINRPESAILGIGRGAWQAAVVEQEIVPRLMLPLTVSYDHRTIDGGTAVRFTLDLVSALTSYKPEDLQYPGK